MPPLDSNHTKCYFSFLILHFSVLFIQAFMTMIILKSGVLTVQLGKLFWFEKEVT